MNLTQLKQEARKELEVQLGKFRPITSGATNDILDTLDTLIDKVVDAVEESVDIDSLKRSEFRSEDFANGYMARDAEVGEAFRNFRGV